ncbi:unnamed protein product [Dicrocoelium dendriticum]|nr:unnamed protein product [Dicrocoelium dendriticum]
MVTFRLSKQGWCVIFILVAVFVLYYLSGSSYVGRLQGDVISIRTLLTQSIYLSEDAGYFIASTYSPSSLETRAKASAGGLIKELLTNMDLASHSVIVSGLSKFFPTVRVISEEHPPSTSPFFNHAGDPFHSSFEKELSDSDFFVPASDLTVWVDPLDATQELTEGLLEYVTVMICITLRGHPIAGVIHQPFTHRTYWAWRDHGISSDLAKIMSDAATSKLASDVLVVTHSRSHLNTSLGQSVIDAFKPQQLLLLPAGGSGFKILSLIQQKAHLYIHPSSTRRWDVCAAHAVLEAAGGRITGLDGSQLSYDPSSPAVIPKTTGLYAASSKDLYDKWKPMASKLIPLQP